jgi:hypothetical protein
VGNSTASVSGRDGAVRESANVVDSAVPDVGADVRAAPRDGAWTAMRGARVCTAEIGT